MSKTKFTPGPRKVVDNGNGYRVTGGPVGVGLGWFPMAGIYAPDGSHIISLKEAQANAMLDAAAPDLYAALDKAVKDYGNPGGPWNVPSEPGTWIQMAKAALKKARGDA